MYQTHKTYIKADMKMSTLFNENPKLLLLMEHLNLDYIVNKKTVEKICTENNIDVPVFLIIANLYNGFFPSEEEILKLDDIATIIIFLKNSHRYYKNDKYPEIKENIKKLNDKMDIQYVQLIEKFFTDYFEEVLEHLNYEDEIAFPYFCALIGYKSNKAKSKFSVNEYREHHTDIETKLTDLKNLLLKHIPLKKDLTTRRKILFGLFELEFDLNIHSVIEESILLPLVDKIEKNQMNE